MRLSVANIGCYLEHLYNVRVILNSLLVNSLLKFEIPSLEDTNLFYFIRYRRFLEDGDSSGLFPFRLSILVRVVIYLSIVIVVTTYLLRFSTRFPVS
jgi:hypothetical protein